MADMMQKKNYDLTKITRLLLEMRENCIPKAGNAYEDPNRAEKYDALNAAIDLINNPSMIVRWSSVKDRLPEDDESYLVWASDCGKAELAMYCGDGEWMTADLENLTRFVTHWMPLPKPPKEEANND